MENAEIKRQWEGAAPGWAKWEDKIASMIEPASRAMLEMAGIGPCSQVLDLACGAGSQTMNAASMAGPCGHVVALDISEKMLQYVRENAQVARLENISTLQGVAEELDIPQQSFDAVICRLGLMLFTDPSSALRVTWRALKPGGRVAVVVFTVPENNAFMAVPMQVLLRHAGRRPPQPGQPGLFALGSPGAIERLMTQCGFMNVTRRTFTLKLEMPSAEQTLLMMKEAFGAYRAVLKDCPEEVSMAAWEEVSSKIKDFETDSGLMAPTEVLVAAGTKIAEA
jgi:SAM-dependent methyltransferase